MARQNVYAYPDPDDFDGATSLAGWFDRDADGANSWSEDTRFDGNNHISLATGSQWDHEELWRSAGGRWVICWWSQWEGRQDRWYFVDDDAARDWLLRNEYPSDKVAQIMGDAVEDEAGPAWGRPPIGPAIKVAVDPDVLAQADAAAHSAGITRAEWVRRAIDQALT